MTITRLRALAFASALAVAGALLPGGSPTAQQSSGPAVSEQLQAAMAMNDPTRGNPACPGEDVAFKPASTTAAENTGYQPDGPAIGAAFSDGSRGRLFVTDSNQGVRGAPGSGNNTSRIMRADLATGKLSPFITGLPTGDHPTEELQAPHAWPYWSQRAPTHPR